MNSFILNKENYFQEDKIKKKQMDIGIVGASGYIGQQLFRRFQQENIYVRGTYHQHVIPGFFHLDLLHPDFSFLDKPTPLTHVIISSAANASLDKTAESWEESYNTNCLGVKKLIEECFQRGIMPIYFSSDGIFDGVKGNYIETDMRNPINKYGLIKKEVEDLLFASGKNFLIIRMSRVFDTDNQNSNLLLDLKRRLQSEEKLREAVDQWFTLIHIDDLFFFIISLLDKKCTGVYHLASLPRISRFDLADAIKQFFGFDRAVLIPAKINFFNFKERRPLDTSLNIGKVQSVTGFRLKTLDFFLEKMR